jgi:phosphosulfolactate synthase
MRSSGQFHTADFLKMIGVCALPASTGVLDPGYDVVTLQSHLEQSSHLISVLKISMACWLIANETMVRRKVAIANHHKVICTTGGGPFEIAVAQNQLANYLDLCADIGVTRIECGEGFTEMPLKAEDVVKAARERNLEVQFELGKKHSGTFTAETVGALIDQGRRWLDAGAVELIVEARESAKGIGLFDAQGSLQGKLADRFMEAFGLRELTFEAPDKLSQFALLDYIGPEVRISNVRLEELLRVEIYRRGLHSDAFSKPNLRPRTSTQQAA